VLLWLWYKKTPSSHTYKSDDMTAAAAAAGCGWRETRRKNWSQFHNDHNIDYSIHQQFYTVEKILKCRRGTVYVYFIHFHTHYGGAMRSNK
jgi:hypothetical protein